MPWSSQNGGGWKSGGGPWGNEPPKKGGDDKNQPPDFEEFLKRGQDQLKRAIPGKPGGMGSPLFIVAAVVLIGIVGFFGFTTTIDTDQEGVVLRFGKYNRSLPPGLHLRWPSPIETVEKPKVTRVFQTDVGMDTIYGRRDIPQESLMLTGDENIVDIDFIIEWKIKDARDYLFNVENPERTVKQVAESAMREIVGSSDIQPILTKQRATTERAVQALMQKVLDGYGAGVEITQVKMQKVDPPAQVIGAFRDVQAAKADKERKKNEADAYANRVIPEARGEAERIIQAAKAYRDQTVAVAKGEAGRFLQVLAEYQKAKDITRKRLYLETMEKVLAGADKIILDSGKSGPGVVPYLPLSELKKKTGAAN